MEREVELPKMFNISNIARMRTTVLNSRATHKTSALVYNCRGFVSLGATGYLAIAAGAGILALGIAVKVQTARLDAAQQKALALEQQVAQWTAAAKACSDSVENAAKAAQDAQKRASAALAVARTGKEASEAEIARLRGSKPVSAECPAGQAASKIREVLGSMR